MQDCDLNLLFIQREDISERKEEKTFKVTSAFMQWKKKIKYKIIIFYIIEIKIQSNFWNCFGMHITPLS